MIDLTYNEPIVGEIRPSTLSDCILIGNNLCDQDVLEVYNYDRSDPVEACLNSYNRSIISMTIEKDDMPIAMFGIQIIDGVAILWMLSTDSLWVINRIFVRNTKQWINKMLVEYPILIAYCDVRNESSERWLKFVGGKIIDTVFMGIDDKPFRKFEFTCKN